MYNFNNLPSSCHEITYEYLLSREAIVKEVFGYDNYCLIKKRIIDLLNILKQIRV